MQVAAGRPDYLDWLCGDYQVQLEIQIAAFRRYRDSDLLWYNHNGVAYVPVGVIGHVTC